MFIILVGFLLVGCAAPQVAPPTQAVMVVSWQTGEQIFVKSFLTDSTEQCEELAHEVVKLFPPDSIAVCAELRLE
jgi:hypothetical protein